MSEATEIGKRPSVASLTPSYRPALALAFLASFLCILSLFLGWVEKLPVPVELRVLVALCLPVFSATSILYPSTLFRERSPGPRLARLIGLSIGLVVMAVWLLVCFGLLMGILGGISLE